LCHGRAWRGHPCLAVPKYTVFLGWVPVASISTHQTDPC
jgi:hypothetical protein